MQTSCDTLDTSTSSSGQCARLVSSSPPDNFSDDGPCQLPSPSAGTRNSSQCEPAVLLVSEPEEFCVELPLELEASVPLVSNKGQLKPSLSSASQNTDGGEGERPISSRRRSCTLILAVTLLLFGGILIPVSWVALRQDPKSSVRTECSSIATRLQWAFVGQGLLLSQTGVLLLCWNRIIHHHSVRSFGLYQRWCICVFSALATVSYAILLVSLSFVIWQMMSSTIYCNWSTTHAVYVVCALTELLAVGLSVASIEIMLMTCDTVF